MKTRILVFDDDSAYGKVLVRQGSKLMARRHKEWRNGISGFFTRSVDYRQLFNDTLAAVGNSVKCSANAGA